MAKVQALVGFVSTIDGKKYRVQQGDELEMPKGADWLKAGLVKSAAKPRAKRTAKKK